MKITPKFLKPVDKTISKVFQRFRHLRGNNSVGFLFFKKGSSKKYWLIFDESRSTGCFRKARFKNDGVRIFPALRILSFLRKKENVNKKCGKRSIIMLSLILMRLNMHEWEKSRLCALNTWLITSLIIPMIKNLISERDA